MSRTATCSSLSGVSGTRNGAGGGATSRPTMRRCSSFPPRPRADRDGGRDDVPLRHSRLDAALTHAKAAAGYNDVAIAGGASTVRQAFAAGAIDELVLDIVPIL